MDVFTTLLMISYLIGVSGNNVPFFLAANTDKSESDIFTSLNTSEKPCTNFYEYSCGGWIDKNSQYNTEPFWNHWQSTAQNIVRRLENILENRKVTDKHLKKAQSVFKTCLRGKQEERHVEVLKKLVQSLSGWPAVTQNWNSNNSYDWSINIAEVMSSLGIYPLLKFHVFIDMTNTTQHALYIERGELNLPQIILKYPQKFKQFIKAYQVWITNTIEYLYPNRTNSDIKSEVRELVKFEIELAKLHDIKDTSEKISIDQLKDTYYSVEWAQFFHTFFNSTVIRVSNNGTVIIRCQKYLKHLLVLISKTKVKTVANYVIWTVVKELSRDTSEYLRRLNFKINKVIFGVQTDLARKEECINHINNYMDTILLPKYLDLYVNRRTIKNVSTMIKNIKAAFIENLRNTRWLHNTTRNLAIKKISELKYIIGFSRDLNNKSILEKKFKNIQFSNNHLENILQLRFLKKREEIERLSVPATFEAPASLFEVNAYYSILQNSIFIPLGMLEEPFYYDDAPIIYNYGALGSLIGHEISHSLDILGRHADSKGNVLNWWSRNDTIQYEAAANCYREQYEKFNVSGLATLGENIADNVGLKISYDAYKNLTVNELNENNMNYFLNDQLFFIGFSQVWCEVISDNFTDEDEHAPVNVRVLATIQNSIEFENAFNCFNEEKQKCKLW